MAKNKQAEEELEDQETADDAEESEEEAEPVKINLVRTYTYNGEHYGPGEVTTDPDTAKVLQKRERQLNRHLSKPAVKRRDGSTTGVVNPGTDPVIDYGADAVSPGDDEMFTFDGEEKSASELWELSDKKLKKGGLRAKDVRRIRELQDAAAESESADEGETDEESDEGGEDEASE
jgi:hypothetical protein